MTTSKSSRRRGKEQREARKRGEEQRRQYTEKEREHALTLVVSGMARTDVAAAIGCSTESIRLWYRKAEAEGRLPVVEGTARTAAVARDAEVGDDEDRAEEAVAGEPVEESAVVPANASPSARSIYAPRDPGQGLAEYEVEKILEYKRRHPSMEPAQLRAQLKRFEGWRLSIKAIARVLKQHGYQLVHRGSRPTGPEPVRFEAPRRNALWQLDFTELHVEGLRLHLLVVLDDFSRFVVGHVLAGACSSDVVVATLGAAIARHGKPEAVRTDRGGAFLSGELGSYLEAQLIDHVVGRSYHPQGGGKVESIIGTVRRELWDVEHFEDRAAAERRLACFFEEYNERRAHMGIDGLTPADRFFGRADRVLAAIDAVSRRRQGALALLTRQGDPVEELSGPRTRAPLEVLRLVVVDGVVELRFCGARVRLGSIEV